MFFVIDWYRICESCKPHDEQWALQTKAILDRVRLSLTDRAQYYHKMFQPSAEYLGQFLGVQKWAIDIFTEELIRAGSAASLSLLINRLDPVLRKVISPVEVFGYVTVVNELISVRNKSYKKPTIIITNKVTGEEEIPDGVVGVLTHDMPDVLSHVSVRARNNKVCFASCFDQNILQDLKSKEGKAISIQLRSANLVYSDVTSSGLSLGSFNSPSIPRGVTLKKKFFVGKYAVSIEEFTNDLVGAKSHNLQYLRGRVPAWIKVPMSVAIPFGVFETVLQADSNKINELKIKMKGSKMPWPGDEEIINADYAFVIHTRNPLSGNSSEIYAEVVKGLGETLVGAYPGRAMSFITRKSDLKSPVVVGYPSKQIGLFIKKSIIFRSDSNGEDLEGYAGAGLYDSVPMDKEEKVVLDYSWDRLIVDKSFQHSIFSKIAEAGKIIEGLYGSAQDIEGVVKDGEVYVVQTRPQM
ncbi:hypothetical protein ACLOJK_003145 [Asimina triloba]